MKIRAAALFRLSQSAVSKNSTNFTPIHNFWAQVSIVICLMWMENSSHAVSVATWNFRWYFVVFHSVSHSRSVSHSPLSPASHQNAKEKFIRDVGLFSSPTRINLSRTMCVLFTIHIHTHTNFFSRINEKFQMNGEKFWLNFECSIEHSNVFWLKFSIFLSAAICVFCWFFFYNARDTCSIKTIANDNKMKVIWISPNQSKPFFVLSKSKTKIEQRCRCDGMNGQEWRREKIGEPAVKQELNNTIHRAQNLFYALFYCYLRCARVFE